MNENRKGGDKLDECDACGQFLNVPHCDGYYYVVGFGMKVCSECYFEDSDNRRLDHFE